MGKQTIPNFLVKRAFLTPHRTALEFDNESYTFSDLYEKSLRIAGQLATARVKKGAYVGVLLKNDAKTVFILCALQLLGVKAVILNNRLTADEISWQLHDAEVSFLLTEKSFHTVAQKIQTTCPAITLYYKEKIIKLPVTTPSIIETVEEDDVCTVMYTSGTTGHPKGVLQTYGNHWWSAVGSALNIGLHTEDCWLCAVPLFHISGYSILMRSLIYGMKIVLLDAFEEEKVIEKIKAEKVSIMSVVSTMLERLITYLKEDTLPAHFRCMLLGGGPAAKELLKACKEKNIPVYQTYGMTETASQVVTLAPEDSMSKLGSCGKVLFPAQLKIMNGHKEAGACEHGEIVIKGPNVTKGYLHRKKETNETIVDGWLHTGDIGYVDEDGFLYVLDRRTDLIISGGENVYPIEIEQVISTHPAVVDAVVVGKNDDTWGEIPVAFILLHEHMTVEVGQLQSYCAKRLASYKVPKYVYFVDEIPRNAAGKVMRRLLKKRLEKEENRS